MIHGNSLVRDSRKALSCSADTRLAIVCSVALTAWTYQAWLVSNGVLPAVGETIVSAGKIQGAAKALASLLVLLVALRAPRLLRPRLVLSVAIGCNIVSLVTLGLLPPSPSSMAVGLVARTVAALLGFYLIGMALSLIPDVRVVALGSTCAVLLATCIASFAPAPAPSYAVVLDTVLSLAILALTWRTSKPLLERGATQAEVSPLRIFDPKASTPSVRHIFALMFIFAAAVGFGTKFGAVGFVPASSNGLSLGVLACIAAWFLLAPDHTGRRHADTLLTVSFALMAAGLLVAPHQHFGGTANALLYSAKLAFTILSWTVLASLCMRCPSRAVAILAFGELMGSSGVLVGDALAQLCNATFATDVRTTSTVTGVALLILLVYISTGLKGFSFTEAIYGAGRTTELSAPIESAPPPADRVLEQACDGLAHEHGLTNREREVLGLLSRGHNGYHVRDELGISYNTAKTHIKRVYFKLNVHSQQELIDLVEHTDAQCPTKAG